MKYTALYLVMFVSAMQLRSQQGQELFFADPTVYVDEGKYYLTGTGGSRGGPAGFSVLESTDLKHWALPEGAKVHMLLTKGGHTYGTEGFWAPQIFKGRDSYYLTYTANEQTVLARSKSVLGPYQQKQVGPIDGSEKNIDSFIFRDDDGKHYLYHVRFNNGNYLWVAEFDMERGKMRPETLKRCFGQTKPWEDTPAYKSAPIMEGPTVIKLKDKYYLFYSANHFRNVDYSVGYAVSDSPYGPWVKQKDSPIIHRSIVGENGSGHGDLFQGPGGQLYYVYHVHFDDKQISPRRTRIVPVTKQWDPKEGLYKFRLEENSIIVPVLSK